MLSSRQMGGIPFPSSYKSALIARSKNTTIRIKNEVGKYQKGKVYNAVSYAGGDWGIQIKVQEVTHTKVSSLERLGIPKRTIKMLLKNGKLSLEDKVDIVKFIYEV